MSPYNEVYDSAVTQRNDPGAQTNSSQPERPPEPIGRDSQISQPQFVDLPSDVSLSNQENMVARSAIPVSNIVALPPPPYEDVVINPLNTMPPPSYDSLYGRVCEAQKQSSGFADLMRKLFGVFLGTIGCTIIVGITIVIPLCMIFMGSFYMRRCPLGEYIPVYLVIGGFIGLIKPTLNLTTHVRRSAEARRLEQQRQEHTKNISDWFALGWFLIGSYWIYRIYEPNYDPSLGPYCDYRLYTFAFWLVSSVYLLVGIMISFLMLTTLLIVFFLRTETIRQDQFGAQSNV